MTEQISQNQYQNWAQEIASKIKVGEIAHDEGVASMTVKKSEKEAVGLKQITAAKNTCKRKTLKELAKEQGVKPITDVSQLTGNWPEGADFDSFYEAAVNSRKHAN